MRSTPRGKSFELLELNCYRELLAWRLIHTSFHVHCIQQFQTSINFVWAILQLGKRLSKSAKRYSNLRIQEDPTRNHPTTFTYFISVTFLHSFPRIWNNELQKLRWRLKGLRLNPKPYMLHKFILEQLYMQNLPQFRLEPGDPVISPSKYWTRFTLMRNNNT